MNKQLKEIKNLWEEEYCDEDNKYNHDFHNLHLNSIIEFIYGDVIDIGCGAGRNIKFLSNQEKVHKVLGIDISSNAIAQAKKRLSSLKNISLQQTQLLNVSGEFNFLYDSSCYIHCDDETKEQYINWVKNNSANEAILAIAYPEWIHLWDKEDENKFNQAFNFIKKVTTKTEFGNYTLNVYKV